jgi:hypothetical protein
LNSGTDDSPSSLGWSTTPSSNPPSLPTIRLLLPGSKLQARPRYKALDCSPSRGTTESKRANNVNQEHLDWYFTFAPCPNQSYYRPPSFLGCSKSNSLIPRFTTAGIPASLFSLGPVRPFELSDSIKPSRGRSTETSVFCLSSSRYIPPLPISFSRQTLYVFRALLSEGVEQSILTGSPSYSPCVENFSTIHEAITVTPLGDRLHHPAFGC